MADKNFKVKSGLNIPIASAAILTTDASGNISSTAVLPITAGGTGQTSATNAINALLPVQNGSTVNYVIQSDGSNINWGKLYNQTIKNNGTTVTPRGIVNIVGATFADDSGTDTTTITFTDTTGVSTSGGSTITTSSASTKGLIIKGAASQTADLQQWQNSSGTVNARIDAYGTFQNGTAGGYGAWINVQPAQASDKGIIIRGAASQTANLQEWQDSVGTVKAFVRSDGFIRADASLQTPTIYGTSATNGTQANIATAWTFLTNVATNTGIIVKGAASQTANLQEWQNSSGTVRAKVDASGNINAVGLSLTSTVSGTMFSVDPTYGGITSRGGAVGFSGSASLNIGTSYNAQSAIVASGFSGQSVPTVIIKAVASQTSNLQEWQNSSGTVLSKVDSSGSMFTTTATAGTNTTQVATTAFVKTAIDNLIASAPGTLDTLDEIAQALNDDPNFYTTITTLTNALAEQDSYTLMGVF